MHNETVSSDKQLVHCHDKLIYTFNITHQGPEESNLQTQDRVTTLAAKACYNVEASYEGAQKKKPAKRNATQCQEEVPQRRPESANQQEHIRNTVNNVIYNKEPKNERWPVVKKMICSLLVHIPKQPPRSL